MLALGKVKSYQMSHMIAAILIISLDTICVSLFPNTYVIALIFVLCTYFYNMMQVHIICKAIKVKPVQMFPAKLLLKVFFSSVLSAAIGYVLIMISHVKCCIMSLAVGFCTFILVYIIVSKLARIEYNILLKSIFTKMR